MGSIYAVRIQDIPQEGLQLETCWSRDDLTDLLKDATQGPCFGSPADLVLRFTPARDIVVFEGSCRTVVRLSCVRCLEDFDYTVESRFRYLLWPHTGKAATTEQELNQDDLEVLYYEDDCLDLRPVIREQVLLGLPAYPHCRESCRGLCAVCGADRNHAECSCADGSAAVSPFNVLQSLKKKP